MNEIDMAAHATAYLWCSLFHRKSHGWNNCKTIRTCDKCKSVYFYPSKERQEQPVPQAPLDWSITALYTSDGRRISIPAMVLPTTEIEPDPEWPEEFE